MISQKRYGFTMIELVIALVVVSILVAVAVPSYRHYITKSRRTDAQAALLSMALAQEKWRASHTTYGTLAQVWTTTTTDGGYYNLAVTTNTATRYVITATVPAGGSQSNDSEDGTDCTSLSYDSNAGMVSRTPAVCW